MKTKHILNQNKEQIDQQLYPYERKAWLLNLFIQKMSDCGYPLTSPESIVSVLTKGVESFVRSSIVESASLELAGGIKLNKAAVFDVVEIPDISEAQSVERLLKSYHHINMSMLDFIDGVFSVKDEVKERIIEANTTYAANERQITMSNDAKELVKAVNKFNKKHGPKSLQDRAGFHPLRDVSEIFLFNHKTQEYEVNVDLITRQFA